MSQDVERELGWDDEIQESGPSFTLLPVGDYNFTVEKFERGRHPGSANLPACNKAVLTLKVESAEHGETTITNNLFLHSKTEGFLSAFFESIGQKKEGERVKMNWNMVNGAKGRCKLEHNHYTSKGEERVNNQVDKFLPYEEYLKHAGQQQGYQQPTQQQYQQPVSQQQPPVQNQTPFPNGQQQPNTQQPPQQGGYTPGQF